MASLERKSGYLLKQGHDQSTWRRRFCVCEDSRLVYYKKQPPVEGGGKGEIDRDGNCERAAGLSCVPRSILLGRGSL